MMADPIEHELTSFIAQEILVEDEGFVLSPEQPLLNGLLDSFGLMSLVNYLEERFDIQVDVGAVTTEHFATIRSLTQFVQAVQAGRASA